MLGLYPNGAGPNGFGGIMQSSAPPDAPVNPPDSSAPPAPAPTAADIYALTIMRVTTIYLQAALGPSAINLTVSLT